MALSVGAKEGTAVGCVVGEVEGVSVGEDVGCCDVVGCAEGASVGWKLVEGGEVGE